MKSKFLLFSLLAFSYGVNAQITTAENGNVGIGTTNPTAKLDLGSNYSDPSSYPNKITLWSGGPNNYFGFGISSGDLDYFSQFNHRFYTGYNGSAGTEKMVINVKGDVGIGTTSPSAKLDVQGDIYTNSSSNEGGSISFYNPLKTGSNAYRWSIYNMTGGYGNSLQFWSYSQTDGGHAFCKGNPRKRVEFGRDEQSATSKN
ncbi:MAG: hypothetical protein C4K58_04365 [Flavobacteriaceae bacterium]|nr:MAG: hypothetical protein C4K58_04365 [Flavobacteriaceae bacterium]